MRDEYITDAQGRTVRAKHAAQFEQTVLWDDIRTAPREHMEVALQGRRKMILGDPQSSLRRILTASTTTEARL